MPFIDLHCDTLLRIHRSGGKESLLHNSGHLDFTRMKEAGVMAQVFAVFLPTHQAAQESALTQAPMQLFTACHSLLRKSLRANADVAAPACSAAQIQQNWQAGRVSAVLGIEDSVLLEGDLKRVQSLYKKGVRVMTLTWNYENSLGYPNSPVPDDTARGLKPFGKEAVQRMQALGILVDVSHLSDGGFWDVAALSRASKVPFAATHSCARSLRAHPRNLTDDMLREIGETGSVCGVNFCASFLHARSVDYTRIDDIVRCARYIRDKAGIDALALGSDFDGIGSKLEFGGCEGLPKLADALSLYFPTKEVEQICWQNALRVFGDAVH